MKIFAAHGRQGPAVYRVKIPLGELGRQPGYDVRMKSTYDLISEGDFEGSDIIVGQRLNVFPLWDYAGRGACLVYEIDDDVFSVLPENRMAYGEYQNPELRESTRQCIARADLVTVSTEPLAEVMRELNPNVTVLPNYVPDLAYDLPVPGRRPCIGWAGGNSHDRDVESIVSPVRRFLRRTGWDLQLVGHDYRSLFKCGELTPWIDLDTRPAEYYSALNFDIGLAPLIGSQFNRCKSPIRVMECAARGIPVIASDVTPYREFIEDGVTGFLVGREHEWLARLSELAADDGLRSRMGAAARASARAQSAGWRQWAAAYDSLS